MDLAPQVRRGTTADDPHGVEASLDEALHGFVEPAAVVGDAFEDRAHQVRAGGGERQVVETAPALRSSTGDRSPASQGVNSTSPLPAGTDAASAVSASKLGGEASATSNRPSAGPITLSLSHCRHSPPVSWLSATRYLPGRSPGTEAIWWTASVFFIGTGQLIHDVVLMARWAW